MQTSEFGLTNSEQSLMGFALMGVIDMLFLVAVFLMMSPIFALRPASYAVMKRNFVNYFSNPTGYVFLCVFVLLTSFAAFWPHEFFANNLANFDQLNRVLPYVMLVFIPAITMSVWAEERRQGTDELLLTLPAWDFDIVIGKYFAAVFVFTVSLLFSQLSNFAVLLALTGGNLDDGILMSTYLGYWFVGLAMLALGMVASFLTNNLTVSFIFGVVLNAPLAFFSNADVIFASQTWVELMYEWSLLRRFGDFGRGLIALPNIVFFVGVAVIGVYLSLVLIGRRHWMGGKDGQSLFGHFLIRVMMLAICCLSMVLLCQYSPLNRVARLDLSSRRVNTLSPDSLTLLAKLGQTATGAESKPRPILIEAYISSDLPPEYVQIRYELVNLLKEFDVIGGDNIQVRLQENISPFGEEAILAENKYGIRVQRVTTRSRGALRDEDIVLGVAFSSGLERVVIPFFHYGMPVEYELIRSITTVAAAERKTIGIIATDSLISGGRVQLNDGRATAVPRAKIISELEKQFNVVDVIPNESFALWTDETKTKRKFDVLMLVQPSKMNPLGLSFVLDAIKTGQPTVIFEDPAAFGSANYQWPLEMIPDQENRDYFPLLQGTSQNRVTGQVSADLRPLWSYLGIQTVAQERKRREIPAIVWQKNSYYPQSLFLNKHLEYVVVRKATASGTNLEITLDPEHQVTGSLVELAFPYPGAIAPLPNQRWDFIPLVRTAKAGFLWFEDFEASRLMEAEIRRLRTGEQGPQVLAAEIHGGVTDGSGEGTRVIYVSDVEVLGDYFVDLRNRPAKSSVDYRFENVSFVLNIFDYLSGEDRYTNIRNKRPQQFTLRLVENEREREWVQVNEKMNAARKNVENTLAQVREEFEEATQPLVRNIEDLQKRRAQGENVTAQLEQLIGTYQQRQQEENQRLQQELTVQNNRLQDEERLIRREAENAIQKIQRGYKVMAVLLPPIPPLILGLVVFTRRRLREREGVSKARLRT
ncbi:MAG: Gldg family protein [Pirellulaceae bacterium]|nr:Gldg family protein [Pirellulaceae bacterium]